MRFRRSGEGWHVAPSLEVLADEIEAWDPTKRAADGTVGDTSHQAGVSDHNPDENGVVRALDAGESDDAQGDQLAEALRASKDDRIAYVIHDERRFLGAKYAKLNGRTPWVWIPYTGPNPHERHNHTSVNEAYDNDTRPWNLFPAEKEDTLLPLTPKSSPDDINMLKDYLNEGYNLVPPLTQDGKWDAALAAQVKEKMVPMTGATLPAVKAGLHVNANMFTGLQKVWIRDFVPAGPKGDPGAAGKDGKVVTVTVNGAAIVVK